MITTRKVHTNLREKKNRRHFMMNSPTKQSGITFKLVVRTLAFHIGDTEIETTFRQNVVKFFGIFWKINFDFLNYNINSKAKPFCVIVIHGCG